MNFLNIEMYQNAKISLISEVPPEIDDRMISSKNQKYHLSAGVEINPGTLNRAIDSNYLPLGLVVQSEVFYVCRTLTEESLWLRCLVISKS